MPWTPRRVAVCSLTATMPMPGVGTRPSRMSCGTMRLTMSTGIAKPMPAFDPDGEMMAVLTPDHPPARIEQRAAGIARIDRRIGLDDVRHLVAGTRRQAPAQRADHPEGQRLVEPERIADGECELADLEIGRTADGDRLGKSDGIAQPMHREIVIGRRADDLGRDHLAGGQAAPRYRWFRRPHDCW